MCTNYRPISLSFTICKVMERIIVNQIQSFLHSNNLITSAQYGFRKGSSTIIQLIKCHSELVETQNNGKATDVIYLDLAKAFDSVSHSKLILKLQAYEISNDLLKWFENFLSNRTQTVFVDSVISDFLPVTSGTP